MKVSELEPVNYYIYSSSLLFFTFFRAISSLGSILSLLYG